MAYAVGNRLARRVVVGAAVLLVCAVPAVSGAQGTSPTPVPPVPPQHRPTVVHPHRVANPADDFVGFHYTPEQKAKIEKIQQDGQLRRDAVVKDQKLSPEQRDAMLQGLQRMERSAMYRVLTPEQQAEVRKRVTARQEAARQQQPHQAQPAHPAPPQR